MVQVDRQDLVDLAVVLVAVDQVDLEEMLVVEDLLVAVDQVDLEVRVDIKDMEDSMVQRVSKDMQDQDHLVEGGLTYRLL